MLEQQPDLLERNSSKTKGKTAKEPSKVRHQLTELGKVIGSTVATAFLTGVAMAAGASAWGTVSHRRRSGDLIPLRKVM